MALSDADFARAAGVACAACRVARLRCEAREPRSEGDGAACPRGLHRQWAVFCLAAARALTRALPCVGVPLLALWRRQADERLLERRFERQCERAVFRGALVPQPEGCPRGAPAAQPRWLPPTPRVLGVRARGSRAQDDGDDDDDDDGRRRRYDGRREVRARARPAL